MPLESTLPADLIRIARSLEEQAQSLQVLSRKIPHNEWDSLPPKTRNLIPSWLKDLLANYSLAGPLLTRPHESEKWERYFCFWLPSTYAERVTPDDPVASKTNAWWQTEEIINAGYIPLSDESDGDMWITPIMGEPTSPVYIYELSGWKIGLISKNIALFLSNCKVCKEQST